MFLLSRKGSGKVIAAPGSGPVGPWVPAKNFTPAEGRKILWVVLHSTENPIEDGVAKNVADWFSGDSAPQASAHYVVGPDATYQGVLEKDVAWAAPGANKNGIQIEMVGQALKTRWAEGGGDPKTAGLPVLRKVAKLAKVVAGRNGIPLRWVSAEEMLAGEKGFTLHSIVTKAARLAREGYEVSSMFGDSWIKAGGDHVDPGGANGERWPFDVFMGLVKGS